MSTHGKTVPAIYVACLASYNSGILYGRWIEICSDPEVVFEEIFDMLKGSPIPNAEEWEIHDYEGFYKMNGYDFCNESIDRLCELSDFIINYDELGAEIYNYNQCETLDDAIEIMENNYCGEYSSELQFAEELFDELYLGDIPEYCHSYIDYKAFRRDIMMGDYYSIMLDGVSHIFSTH